MNTGKRTFSFFFAYTAFNLAASFAHPVTPTVIQNLNLPDYMFGLALATMMTSMFLFSPFWGLMTSRISSRLSLCISCIGYALAQAMFGLSTTMAGILCARFLAGMFTSGCFVASLAYVANVSPEEKRPRNLTLYATIQSVGSAFGYFIGGMLGELGTGYAFLAQVVVLTFSGISFLIFCVPDGREGEPLTPRKLFRECNPLIAFTYGRYFMNFGWAMLLGVCCMAYLGDTAFEQVFNYYIKDVFGLGSSWNGTIKFAVGIIAILANSTICVYLLNRTDTRKSTIPVMLIAAVTVAGVILAPNLASFMIISVLFFACYSVSVPLTQNLVADRAEGSKSGLIMGFYQAVRAVGGVVGALLAGFLYEINPKVPFLFAGAGFAAAVVCGILYVKNVKKEEA